MARQAKVATSPGRTATARWLIAAAAALGLGGCTDYTITSTVERDGGGRRTEVVRVTSHKGDSLRARNYVQLLGLGSERGWTHRTEGDGDTTHVFERSHRISDAAGWARLSGSVRVDGTTPEYARSTVGRSVLGDVRFSNRVELAKGRSEAGATYSYRETFSWTDGADPIVERFATSLADALARRYPRLSEAQRGEILGLARGGLWAMIDAGLGAPDSGLDDDVLIDRLVRRTAEQIAASIGTAIPGADASEIETVVRSEWEDEGNLAAFIETLLPGFDLATSMEINLRLVLPGRVIRSNADDVKGDTLIWNVDPMDALNVPTELSAESIVEGG